MLAPSRIPSAFKTWNAKWHAPLGRLSVTYPPGSRYPSRLDAWRRGLFGFQPNNTTRVIEYPWAFFVVPLRPGSRVVEIGGALSGFQFVLSRQGVQVWNVDPFVDYGTGAYGLDPDAVHARLNRYFRTDVTLCRSTLSMAALPSDSFDAIYCISTIEHLDPDELKRTIAEASRILRRGGVLVSTIDLFLNLQPFTRRAKNEWGHNISIRELVDRSGMRLIYGDPHQLYGFEAFDAERILANLERYFIGGYPALTQLVVLTKDGGDTSPVVREGLFPGR